MTTASNKSPTTPAINPCVTSGGPYQSSTFVAPGGHRFNHTKLAKDSRKEM